MDDMKCYECVLKHISTALSFGKQILSGHGKGNELDHRIDFLGQISNAEQHLELIDQNLFQKMSIYRKNIQEKQVAVTAEDLAFLRNLYLLVEMVEDGNYNGSEQQRLDSNPNIVYLKVTNKDYFDLSYKTLKAKLENYDKIYVLSSDVDLTEYTDVTVLNKDIKTFSAETDNNFILMYENSGFLKTINAKEIPNSFTMNAKDIVSDVGYLRSKGITAKIYCYDRLKAVTVLKDKFNEVMTDYQGQNYVTVYSYLSDKTSNLNDVYTTVTVDRAVCCSTKTNLKIKQYVRWNENGFESLKQFLGY